MESLTSKKKGRFTVKFSPSSSDLHTATVLSDDSITDGSARVSIPSGNDDEAKLTEKANEAAADHRLENKKNLYLYEEDMKHMPRVATFLNTVMMAGTHTTYPSEKEEREARKKPKKAKLGVLLGVYFPTIQHIMGLLMFIRHAWIVGCSGVIETFFMVLMCCMTTFVTAISVSAIATNGMVQGGGSYYMLSRNLGPECGGSIGICFYLANTFGTCLYLLGSIELLLLYMVPEIAFFGDIHKDPWNNYRLYGTVFMIALTLLVAVGVKFVQLFAPVSLVCVIVSILSIFVGSFVTNSDTKDTNICFLGDRLLMAPHHWHPENDSSQYWCNKNVTGDVWSRYCTEVNDTMICDPYFLQNDVRYVPAIPGIFSGTIKRNAFSHYLEDGEVTPGVQGDEERRREVVSDITTSFVALCAIYFPSVTGILTGANMSGDLRDPQQSIPIGTILAQLTCSLVYLALVLLYGATVDGAVLRDKHGSSLDGELVAALLCWPNKWVVLVGAFASSMGAALQCLVSAPRLLQAIARDDIIPFLRIFKKTTASGEPLRALALTFVIAEIGILIANIDTVAPIIDVFFLMCYLFVNLICVLQTVLKMPNWRPRFKYYHWSLSVVGVLLNFALCIIAGWYYALASFAIAAFIYIYIQYTGGEKEWGDGISGLTMSTAQKALLALEEEPHTKNWRPQLLVLCKLNSDELTPEHPRFFSLAAQLKAGRGLTVLASVLSGDFLHHADEAEDAEKALKAVMEQEKVKGFAKVMVTNNITEGLCMLIQTVGLGGFKHNTVMVGWPSNWRQSNDSRSWEVFLETVRHINAKGLALLVPKGIENFPERSCRLNGTIDIWWIVHDGGMLILLSFLLQQNKVWKGCQIRIFTVAHIHDNSIQMRKDLETYLYQIRITAEIHVVEMYDSDISVYAVERTLDMEKRIRMMKEMRSAQLSSLTSSIHKITSTVDMHLKHHDIQDHHQTTSVVDIHLKHHDSQDHHHNPSYDGTTSESQTSESQNAAKRSSQGADENSSDEDDGIKMKLNSATEPTDEQEEFDKVPVHFTFSAAEGHKIRFLSKQTDDVHDNEKESESVAQGELMRMHTAVQLNKVLQSKSSSAELVIINFPAPPAKLSAEENYMEYLEMLTEGLNRVLMVRGSGKEVVTIYS